MGSPPEIRSTRRRCGRKGRSQHRGRIEEEIGSEESGGEGRFGEEGCQKESGGRSVAELSEL